MARFHLGALLPLAALMMAADSNPSARKWEGPVVPTPAGQCKTTIYYGPWQCSQALFETCEATCRNQGHPLMGCIWIADIKIDCQGKLLSFFDTRYGSRAAIDHCCCDYPTVTDLDERRDAWKNGRDAYRNEWGKEFGSWPQAGSTAWPGHHIIDLLHGGAPLGTANVLPVPPERHTLLNSAYPKCYEGQGGWNTPGPNLPYTDF